MAILFFCHPGEGRDLLPDTLQGIPQQVRDDALRQIAERHRMAVAACQCSRCVEA